MTRTNEKSLKLYAIFYGALFVIVLIAYVSVYGTEPALMDDGTGYAYKAWHNNWDVFLRILLFVLVISPIMSIGSFVRYWKLRKLAKH